MSDHKVLIIESRANGDISYGALCPVLDLLKQMDMCYEKVETRNVLSIPCAAAISLEFVDYIGAIALGCVIDELDYNALISVQEAYRGMGDLSMQYYMPVGIGICHAKNLDEANRKVGAIYLDAASSCIQLMKLRSQGNSATSNNFISRYNN
ncbi:6,7-dimethyl-8-ribityllumazine synthase [Candidatus Cyrtobacter comes]|uniref:6,7-dimethyl-8-ribityllumazine synthase n=1 Tax=Candidatus Cyrtobacter comes TaxID=675776 RepID=A0ABU5L6E9_9RICK|nr:6,7-dimethyl-8-ribityllumazine synthase [Candidatus Cyrtobacter comes]MDZ5761702.1 6,7-dimethyl-8-ribityllumazine synthase [Candidatus Cyrtobacter comes]